MQIPDWNILSNKMSCKFKAQMSFSISLFRQKKVLVGKPETTINYCHQAAQFDSYILITLSLEIISKRIKRMVKHKLEMHLLNSK